MFGCDSLEVGTRMVEERADDPHSEVRRLVSKAGEAREPGTATEAVEEGLDCIVGMMAGRDRYGADLVREAHQCRVSPSTRVRLARFEIVKRRVHERDPDRVAELRAPIQILF